MTGLILVTLIVWFTLGVHVATQLILKCVFTAGQRIWTRGLSAKRSETTAQLDE